MIERIKSYYPEGSSSSSDDYIIVVDKSGNEYKRKIYHVISNVYKFRFKNKIYHMFWYLDGWYMSPEYFEYLDKKYYYKQEELKDDLFKLIEKFEDVQTEDESIPSAPDSSKFISVQKGDIGFRENYRKHSQYGSDTMYYFVVTVGNAIKNLDRSFYDNLFTIYLNAIKSEFTIDYQHPRIGKFCGSAFCGYGIRK